MKANVVYMKDAQAKDLGGGVHRSLLAYNEEIMMVEIRFETGCKIAPHSHPHTQWWCLRATASCSRPAFLMAWSAWRRAS